MPLITIRYRFIISYQQVWGPWLPHCQTRANFETVLASSKCRFFLFLIESHAGNYDSTKLFIADLSQERAITRNLRRISGVNLYRVAKTFQRKIIAGFVLFYIKITFDGYMILSVIFCLISDFVKVFETKQCVCGSCQRTFCGIYSFCCYIVRLFIFLFCFRTDAVVFPLISPQNIVYFILLLLVQIFSVGNSLKILFTGFFHREPYGSAVWKRKHCGLLKIYEFLDNG